MISSFFGGIGSDLRTHSAPFITACRDWNIIPIMQSVSNSDPVDCSIPWFYVLHCLCEFVKLTSIESVMPSNHLILCHPLLLPSIFPSIRAFFNESVLRIRWPKYWSFSFSISPSNEYSGLVCFRMDWLDLLAVQGALKSLFQHHNSKASVLWCLAFFVQRPNSHICTWLLEKQ